MKFSKRGLLFVALCCLVLACSSSVSESVDTNAASPHLDAAPEIPQTVDLVSDTAPALDHTPQDSGLPDVVAPLDHTAWDQTHEVLNPLPDVPDTVFPDDTTVTEDVAPVDAAVTNEGTPQPPAPLPYPDKTPYQVKGLQPDHWPDKNEIAGNGTGAVAMNMVWYGWEPSPKAPPCGEAEQEFDGRCFAISDGVDGEIRDYTERGLVVTGVLYGVPEWARQNVACSPITAGFEVFCAPDDEHEYARFAGMLAQRYNGLNGNGRIADFVIHNEVNSNDWFDIGCGQGVPCDQQQWVATYAANYAAAYDAIVEQQPHAKVLMSFTHHFDTEFDKPAHTNPTLSVKTFVTTIAPMLGQRDWRIAYHPYPPNLLSPVFSPDDLPRVTYGNIGIIVGWLMAAFPEHPHAWDVQLTESGVNSLAP